MSVSPVPDHLRSVTPSIVCTPCADAIDFYERAFGAVEVPPRMTGPDGSIGHAEIRIGDSVIMLADEWPGGPTLAPPTLGGSTVALFIYTDDVDAMWERALEAGAEVVFPLEFQFYGEKGEGCGIRSATPGASPNALKTWTRKKWHAAWRPSTPMAQIRSARSPLNIVCRRTGYAPNRCDL